MSGALAGRVAIVTGGGWNIGRAAARRLAAEGAAVALASRDPAHLEAVAGEIRAAGGRALAVPTDVTDLTQVEALVARTLAEYGGLHAMLALAGGQGAYGSIETVDPTAWVRCVQVNLVGAFHCARAALPVFRRQDQGALVFCAGGGAFFPILGREMTAYACAKAALCRLTDQLTAEYWDTAIRVNCLEPGLVWNEDTERRIAAEERATGRPHPERAHARPAEDAAELALWLVSDQSRPLRGRMVSVGDTWWRDPAKVRIVDQHEHLYRVHRHYLPEP